MVGAVKKGVDLSQETLARSSLVSTRRLALAVASGGVAIGGMAALAPPAYAGRIYWSACAHPGTDHGNSPVSDPPWGVYGPNEARGIEGPCSGTGDPAACVQAYHKPANQYTSLLCSGGNGGNLIGSSSHPIARGQTWYANARICHMCHAGTFSHDQWLYAWSGVL
jgi:hypothetical protein